MTASHQAEAATEMFSVCKSLYSWEGVGTLQVHYHFSVLCSFPLVGVCREMKQKLKNNRVEKNQGCSPHPFPLPPSKWAPRQTPGGRGNFVDILHKPKQEGGVEIKRQTKTHKNPCLQLCTQSKGSRGVARKQGLCGRGSVCM